MTAQDIVAKENRRKLLALDGGGIRGLISIEVLAEIERVLREQSGKPQLVLADYFDYIAGTSTGAVIGTLLSLGKPVDEIRQTYLSMGEMMFSKPAILKRFEQLENAKRYADMFLNVAINGLAKRISWLKMPYAEYPDEPMIKELKRLIGDDDVTLGTSKLRTLLMLVLSNASTDSPWPVSNNPLAKYNHPPTRPNNNLSIPLWQLVRASTAAPTVFPAQRIEVGSKRFMFVDGGVTPYNNPAFQLFLQATLAPYELKWAVGEQQMLLISVGTGLNPKEDLNLSAADMNIWRSAEIAMASQFNSAVYQQDLLCRTFGKCLEGATLDSEVQDMKGMPAPGSQKLFTYARYNTELTRKALDALGLVDIDPKQVNELDSVQHMDELVRIGKAVAKQVKGEHFAGFPLTLNP